MMTQTNTKRGVEAAGAANLRRQIRTEINSRFLHNLPAFKMERTLPDDLEVLLDRLDHVDLGRRLS
ncbi:hypothetical protein JYU29_13730 [Tianweitania sp. BSSL-BM11]|uniref:Anti-sigma factor NepR domain-containing protein n=1 Tax=Tianweitania aestuarii TaxID=2814886 RepID=A0ABS5RY73_9HYPH|nr:hypothetical protein [Tianweitania aestuarii]MBS9721745.1 hypothetical protein [Tianweitania aestuarii]